MWQHEYSIETFASPETIWAIFCDVPGWPKWIDGLDHAEIAGPFEAGTELTLIPSGQGPVSSRLVEVKANEGFIDESGNGDVVIRVEHRLQRIDSDQTRIVYAIQVSGPSAENIGKAVSSDFPDVLKALASLAETKN